MSEDNLNAAGEDEYEEIDVEEVDRVVAALESLMEFVESESVAAYLEEAATGIYNLVYDEEEGEGEAEDDTREAA